MRTRTLESETKEFFGIAETSAKLILEGARALFASGVDKDECVLASAMLLIVYARFAGLGLEEAIDLVKANWDEGGRQLRTRGHHVPERGRS